jgi:mannose-1-phosphate guanylyltransferase
VGSEDYYGVIMSGGRGKRFWPLSQASLPKQFLRFRGEGTLFQQTYRRLRRLMPADHIYTITREAYRQIVLDQVPEFLQQNVLVEPVLCNTGPCVALGATYVQHRAPQATIAVLPADHHIADETGFIAALRAGLDHAAATRELVTFGIQPESPDTGLGYVQVGKLATCSNEFRIHHVRRFVEKPDLQTAMQLVASGEWFWNSGIFCFRADVILEAFERTLPEVHKRFTAFRDHIGRQDEADALMGIYEKMPSISIDHGVMERSEQLVVIPVELGWNDVGSWASLRRLHSIELDDNLVIGGHLLDQVTGSTVVGSGRIVVIGVDDVIISSNAGYVLVCAKDEEHRVQAIVDQLEADRKL